MNRRGFLLSTASALAFPKARQRSLIEVADHVFEASPVTDIERAVFMNPGDLVWWMDFGQSFTITEGETFTLDVGAHGWLYQV